MLRLLAPELDLDAAAVAQIAAGEPPGLEALYDRHATAIYSLAVRILRDSSEAEDVTQDVFTQVWTQAGRFDRRRGSVAAWLLMMARSRALDRLRRKRAALKPGPNDPALTDIPDISPSVELLAATNQDAEAARDAIAQLPAAERTAINLAYFEGLTQHEIAERTSAPLGTVKTRVRTALRRVRDAMIRPHTTGGPEG